jgi:hypothetical protein
MRAVMDPDLRVQRLLRVYTQAAGESTCSSGPFRRLGERQRDAVLKAADVPQVEQPFLIFIGEGRDWTLVTLERIVWNIGDHVSTVPITEIKHVGLPQNVLKGLTPDKKRTCSKLELKLRNGERIVVPWEPGGPLAGFWNVVKTMSERV